jgi:hypothetical protein
VLISSLLDYADRYHPQTEIVSRAGDATEQRYGYAEAAARARGLASALQASGVRPGDRIASLAPLEGPETALPGKIFREHGIAGGFEKPDWRSVRCTCSGSWSGPECWSCSPKTTGQACSLAPRQARAMGLASIAPETESRAASVFNRLLQHYRHISEVHSPHSERLFIGESRTYM